MKALENSATAGAVVLRNDAVIAGLQVLLAFFVVLPMMQTVVWGQSVRTVALSGDFAPVGSGDVFFSRFEVPAIDDYGRTAFLADIAGPGARGEMDAGVFSEASGALDLLARHGDQAIGLTDGIALDRFSLFNYSATGKTVFHATLSGVGVTDANDTSLWAETAGGLGLVARAGDPVPGAGDSIDYAAFFTRPAVNDTGRVTFFPEVYDSSANILTSGLVGTTASGSLALVAKAGDVAAGVDERSVFLEQGFENPFSSRTVIDAAGGTVMIGFLGGDASMEPASAGIWVQGGDGDLHLLVRNGDRAPGTIPPVDFLSFAQLPRVNAHGDVAFAAFLTRPNELEDLFNVGIWRGTLQAIELVARTNSLAPMEEQNVRFGDVSLPNLNDRGDVSFQAVLKGAGVTSSSELSLWTKPAGSDSELRLVARAGDLAPGTDANTEFRAFSTHVLNADGRMAFMAVVGGPGVSVGEGNVHGIWAENLAGELVLIARDGDELQVAPGDVRTISGLAFQANTGNSDGQPSGYNDDGLVAFRAQFADGTSGVFVSDLATVPEPKATFWAVIMIGCIGRQWLRKQWMAGRPGDDIDATVLVANVLGE